MRISEFEAPIYVTGLPFDMHECLERLYKSGQKLIKWEDKKDRVVFTSRFDAEKQPHFFMDLIERWNSHHAFPKIEFALLQGGTLRSNDESALERAKNLQAKGWLSIYSELDKESYYSLLNDSKIQINTALQDFVSNTLNEASAFNVKSLVPAFRSFPEALNNNAKYMYVPWSMEDLEHKLLSLLTTDISDDVNYPATYNTRTLDRVCHIFKTESKPSKS